MEKQLKDFLHLYGIGVKVKFDNKVWAVLEFKKTTVRLVRSEGFNKRNECYYEEVKPILWRLEDINEEHKKEVEEIFRRFIVSTWEDCFRADVLRTDYLRSKGYWIGSNDWFDEGLIIDADTIKQ